MPSTKQPAQTWGSPRRPGMPETWEVFRVGEEMQCGPSAPEPQSGLPFCGEGVWLNGVKYDKMLVYSEQSRLLGRDLPAHQRRQPDGHEWRGAKSCAQGPPSSEAPRSPRAEAWACGHSSSCNAEFSG